MRVERLQLENYRGFASLDVTFAAAGPTVFIGENGSGKSSLIDLVATATGIRLDRGGWHLGSGWIRRGAQTMAASVEFEDAGICRLNARSGGRSSFTADTEPVLEHLVFATVRTVATTQPAGQPGYLVHRPIPDDLCPEVENDRLLDWFRRTEDLENEVRLNDDPAHRNPELEAVRRALTTFANALPDFSIGRPRFSRVGQWANDGRGTFLLDKGNTTLGFDQLSDGESFVILLVADMARRLAEPRNADDEPDPLQRPGILLIDEIDQHLHPRWQRAILPALGATFPNVQVIATTHSPTVVGSLAAANVVRLKDFQVAPTPHTYGRDSTTILEDVMGLPAHPSDIQRRLDDLARLIDADDLRGARAALDQLADVLGADAPEVTRYDTTLALLGEG